MKVEKKKKNVAVLVRFIHLKDGFLFFFKINFLSNFY